MTGWAERKLSEIEFQIFEFHASTGFEKERDSDVCLVRLLWVVAWEMGNLHINLNCTCSTGSIEQANPLACSK